MSAYDLKRPVASQNSIIHFRFIKPENLAPMNKPERFFDKISRKSNPEPNQTASKIIVCSREFLEDDNYLLDFGCGSGAITNKHAEVVRTIDAILAFNVLHYIEDLPKLIEKIDTLLKPNGLFISSTACLKERRSFIGYLVLLLTKMGIMPKIYFYKKNELESLITAGNFHMIKAAKLSKLPEYFIVAKKGQ